MMNTLNDLKYILIGIWQICRLLDVHDTWFHRPCIGSVRLDRDLITAQ